MTRMQFIITAVLAVIIAVCLATIVFAQEGAGSAVAPSSMFYDLWTIVQPLVTLFVSIVGPVLITWIAARLINLLKVSDEKQKIEIEAKLREALHQSATNGLKFAIAKAGVPSVIGSQLTETVLGDAAAYVEQKNAETLSKLGVDPAALKDIILSKLPDVALRKPAGL